LNNQSNSLIAASVVVAAAAAIVVGTVVVAVGVREWAVAASSATDFARKAVLPSFISFFVQYLQSVDFDKNSFVSDNAVGHHSWLSHSCHFVHDE